MIKTMIAFASPGALLPSARPAAGYRHSYDAAVVHGLVKLTRARLPDPHGPEAQHCPHPTNLTLRPPRSWSVCAQANVDVSNGLEVEGETHFIAKVNPE